MTALHIDGAERDASRFSKTGKKRGEEQEAETSQRTESPDVTSRCTEVCVQNTVGIGRSCAKNAPWGQRLDLGWVVLGDTCLDGAHKPVEISTFKTQVLYNDRPSLFIPCLNRFYLKHDTSPTAWGEQEENTPPIGSPFDDGLGRNVFVGTNHDNKPGISTEDRRFLKSMGDGMKKNENGSWEAPLPFRHDVKDLPSSRVNAMKRLKSTRRTLDKNPVMKEQYFTFMQKIFDNDHAEIFPQEDLRPDKLCWYLPHFGVYHPKKKDKIRVVFDSTAESNGVSLNKLLVSGPDLTITFPLGSSRSGRRHLY